jgi:hypothetical protein
MNKIIVTPRRATVAFLALLGMTLVANTCTAEQYAPSQAGQDEMTRNMRSLSMSHQALIRLREKLSMSHQVLIRLSLADIEDAVVATLRPRQTQITTATACLMAAYYSFRVPGVITRSGCR